MKKKSVCKATKEIQDEREEVDSQYESGLPDYLIDFFDNKELQVIDKKVHKGSKKKKRKFVLKKKEEFWNNNTGRLIKKSVPIPGGKEAIYEEPTRADERVSEERDLTEEEIAVLKTLSEEDLYLFAVRYFPHYLKKPSSKLHKYLYKLFEREINNTRRKEGCKHAIAAPRANSKSSIVSGIFPIWCIIYSKKKFIIIVSDTKGQAEDFLADIKRELESNSKLLKDFPHVCGKGPTWRQDEIITNNGIKVLALGTGSKIRGRKFGVNRPDLLLGDDLENMEMVKSETQRTFVRDAWFDKDFIFAGGEEGSTTDFFIVGTILGKESLLNKLLDPAEYPDWHSKKFKAVESFSDSELWDEWQKIYTDRFNLNRKEDSRIFFENHKEEMLKGTKVLWPEGDPYYNLMVDRLKNRSAFESEKQGSPVDPSKIYVTLEELHMVRFRGNPEIEECIERAIYFGAIDPSLGKNKKSDRSCIITLARDPVTGFIFVIDISLKRRSVDDQVLDICKLHIKYNYKMFGIETNAFQYVMAVNLRKKSRKLGLYIPIKELVNYRDKVMRIEGIFPFIKDGTIVFDKNKYNNNNQYNLGVTQICEYMGEGDEDDDCPDGMEMCFRLAQKPKFKMLTKQNTR